MTTEARALKATPAQRVVFWVLVVFVPAVKTWQLIAATPDVSDVQRQVGLAVVVAVATAWFIAKAEALPGLGGVARWLVAVGLRPDPYFEDDRRWHKVRWGVALVGLVVSVATTLSGIADSVRLLGAGAAAVCVGVLAVLEIVRYRRWKRRPAGTTPPDRRVAWTSTPLTLTCIGASVALAVRSGSGGQSGTDLAELVVITAFGEEFIYRGCMLVLAYRVLPSWAAQVVTALSFGAWHLGDAWNDSCGDDLGWRVVRLVATALATAVGGLVFTFVRRRSRSLVGSVLAHVATNLPGRALQLAGAPGPTVANTLH